MFIDFHVHIFPDHLAERAVASLAENSGLRPVCAANKRSTVEFMRASGAKKIVCQNIAVSPRTMHSVNDFAIASADDFVIPFGSVHPEGDWKSELCRLAAAGIKGIKFHPEYQNFFIDDETCYPMYEEAFRLGFVLLFHCGLDLAYRPPWKASPQRIANFARQSRGEKIVAAHLGGFSEPEEVKKHLAGLGLYADLAALASEYDTPTLPKTLTKELINAMIAVYGADKVLFATDCPWESPTSGLAALALANLTAEERENVLYRNAERLLNL